MSVDSILFMFTGLAIGIVTSQILSRYENSMPYTVVIFVIGIVITLFSKFCNEDLASSVQEWSSINPEILLMIFLPPLVFGEAMSLNWLHVIGGFWQSLLLAGPGVILGAFAIGGLTKLILPYSWSWNLAMIFGSILSATDTVAVVALLKGANASPKLTILIVGESLLNDASAILLFDFFSKMLDGDEFTLTEMTLFFLNTTFGSIIFGVIFGLVIVYWMRTADRRYKYEDSATQISITICCGYLVYFIAQNILHQSGVLACVVSGAMLAWLAPPVVLNQKAMHHVWGMIEWFLNTLLFLVAGLKLGGAAWHHLTWVDGVYVVLLYLLAMAVRAATIGLFYPLLSTIGHKCTLNEAIFISWAGLRGAVPIALVLLVTSHRHTLVSDIDCARLFFYVGGIAAFTLIINATFAKSVLRHLGLIGDSSFEKLVITYQLRKRLCRRMNGIANEVFEKEALSEQNAEYIRSTCTLLSDFSGPFSYVDGQSTKEASRSVSSHFSQPESSALKNDTIEHPTILTVKMPSLVISRRPSSHPDRKSRASSGEIFNFYNNNNTVSDNNSQSLLSLLFPYVDASNPSSPRRVPSSGTSYGSYHNYPAFLQTPTKLSSTKNPSKVNILPRILSRNNLTADCETDVDSPIQKDVVSQLTLETADNSNSDENRTIVSDVAESAGEFDDAPWESRRRSLIRILSFQITQQHKHSTTDNYTPHFYSPINFYINPDLVNYHRAVLLEIVRARYWKEIDSGRLPRNSYSARFLLHSIDVGLDNIVNATNLQDWTWVEAHLDKQSVFVWMLFSFGKWLNSSYIANILGVYEAEWENNAVYILTSFIEAHTHAQTKLHDYAGVSLEDDDVESGMSTPVSREEDIVKEESAAAVNKAKKMLSELSVETVDAIRLQQISRMLLAQQGQLVDNLLEEGVMTYQNAEELFDEIERDTASLEQDRERALKCHLEERAKQRANQMGDLRDLYKSYTSYGSTGINFSNNSTSIRNSRVSAVTFAED